MANIQQQLLRDDAFLIGVLNDEPMDLAHLATVTASSEQEGGAAVNIISGQTRSVHGENGAPPDRAIPGTHRWMSDPADGLPAWLELAWDEPIRIVEVQLIFDTGLHRHLTLSHHDGYTRSKMIWGKPQPETVRDYRIELLCGGEWETVADVTGNYQRLRRHAVPHGLLVASRVRVTVSATNGLDHARVVEVRVRST